MLGRLRLALWRHGRILAALYLGGLLGTSAALAAYYFLVPDSLDMGLAIAWRTIAFRQTFEAVDRARDEVSRGRLREAEAILDRFLHRHGNIQPARVDFPAVIDASLLLADVTERQGRPGAAARVLRAMTELDPLDYRTWWKLGLIEERRGDVRRATSSLKEAFGLSPNHPRVTEDYLALLSQTGARDDVVWVAEQFERAAERGRPAVQIKAAGPRSAVERAVLSWVGIPIEHGDYGAVREVFGLERGRRRRVVVPEEMLRAAPPGEPLYVQLRFENVYEGLTIDALRWRTGDGREAGKELDRGQVSELHDQDSSAAWYAEIRTNLLPRDVISLEVLYSCPEAALGRSASRAVEVARMQLAGGTHP